MRRFYTLFSLLFLASISAFAGSLTGVIKDASTNTPLTGVMIALKSAGKGASSDIDGKYQISDVPDGKYEIEFSFIGYKKQTTTVTIKGATMLDMTIAPDKSQLKEVTVKTNKITHTENAVIMEMRKSNVIVSGISAAQISKTMDRNAADVVKRIPGVTIQDDKFIMIRGLTDRYNTVWLNDAGAPSSEIDKKAFSFDLIPSGLIDRIMIYKTPSAELPGDFAGGAVKIYTTTMPEKNSLTVGFQTSSRENSTGSTMNYNKASSTDWLGYDNGMRSLPKTIPNNADAFQDPANEGLAKQFYNGWPVYTKSVRPDMRFNLAASNLFHIGKVKLGNTFGVSYANVTTNYNIHRRDWDSLAAKFDYNDQESVNKASVSVMENLGASFGRSKIEFRNLYNQTGTSRTVVRNSNFIPQDSNNIERSYIMGYESVATYASQLSGTHETKNAKTKYSWTLGYSDLFKNAPDLMRIRYNKTLSGDTTFRANAISYQVDPVYGGGEYYYTLNENVYSFNQNLMHKFDIGNERAIELNVGSYFEYKDRRYTGRSFGFTIAPGSDPTVIRQLKANTVNTIFGDENIGGPNKFIIQDATNLYDSYTAQNKLFAGYASVNVPVSDRLKVIAGARYEYNIQAIQSYNNTNKIDTPVTTKFLLPSLNITYNITAKSLVRLAYGKTLNRPEFREWAPLYFYDVESRSGLYGSLYQNQFAPNGQILKVAEIQNFDARWEYYAATGEMLQAGVFYKNFKNPIQKVIIPGGDNNDYTFINPESAYCAGIELDARKNLAFADAWLNTKFFKSLSLVGNASFTKSSLHYGDVFNGTYTNVPDTKLQGQSPYVFNLGFYYQNDVPGVRGSLLYNVFGPRVAALGLEQTASVIEMPFNSLDIAVEKTFFKHYIINVGVQNLLNQTVKYIYDTDHNNKYQPNDPDKELKTYQPGRYYTLGVKVRF